MGNEIKINGQIVHEVILLLIEKLKIENQELRIENRKLKKIIEELRSEGESDINRELF